MKNTNIDNKNNPESPKLMCGIVMPVSEIDGCTEGHWKEVFNIISQSIDKAGFNANLVSNADDVGVIQKRIIQNLYDNPIVVVDVSGKNPNVMLELGIRLAFDKPTIIIKDDKTKYSFDTSPIEHLEYPRDLRFSKIIDFKERLAEKIKLTHKKAEKDENFSTFLKHFGSFKVAKIETEVVSKEDYILEEMQNLREIVLRNNRTLRRRDFSFDNDNAGFDENDESFISMCFEGKKRQEIIPILNKVQKVKGVDFAEMEELDDNHYHIEVKPNRFLPRRIVINKLEQITGDKTQYIR